MNNAIGISNLTLYSLLETDCIVVTLIPKKFIKYKFLYFLMVHGINLSKLQNDILDRLSIWYNNTSMKDDEVIKQIVDMINADYKNDWIQVNRQNNERTNLPLRFG